MKTLGVGVIGFGFIGKVHTYGYTNIPLFYDPAPVATRLVGVATSRKETAEKARVQGCFEFGTDDWRELIERDDIQIINICSPNSQHLDQVVAAMKAGKHIYCDKPLVVGSDAIKQIETAMLHYHSTFQMTLQYRFYPPTLLAKKMIDEGFLGEILSFRAIYLHSGSVDANKKMGWKQLKSEGGGVLQDLGSHILDLMDHLIGPISEVLAQTRIIYPQRPDATGKMVDVEVEDHMIMLAKLSTGAMGTIEASKIATGSEDDMRFEIHGSKGALRFNLMDTSHLEAYDLRDHSNPLERSSGWQKIATVQRYESRAGSPDPRFGIGWMSGHMHCLYSFLRSIADGTLAQPSLQRGIQLQKMLASVQESAETSTWTKLPTQ